MDFPRCAWQQDRIDILNCLIEARKCDPNAKYEDGFTLLHYAAESGKLDFMKYLVLEQHVNAKEDVNGLTALHLGCVYLPVTKWLVEEQHLDVNAKESMGETPLHFAAASGALDVVQWLVQNGADANALDGSGKTPAMAAAESDTDDSRKTAEWLEDWMKHSEPA